MTAVKVFYFIPNSRVVRFRCIVSAIIYHLVHFWCTVFGETACVGLSYSVICDILFDGAATSGIGLQAQFSAGRCKTPLLQSCPSAHDADRLHWLSCYIFTCESSYCFHCVLAVAILSVRLSLSPSVRPTVTWVERDRAYVRPWRHATIVCDPDTECGICILT